MTSIDPDRAIEKAIHLCQSGRLAEAEEIFAEILRESPQHADATHLFGLLHARTGRLDSAIELISRAISLNGAAAAYPSDLGNALRMKGDLDGAIAAYRRAIQLDPQSAPAHANLGNALRQAGRLDEAVTSLERAAEVRPDWAAPHNSLNLALRLLGRRGDAVAAGRRAVQLGPNVAEFHLNWAAALGEAGRPDEAINSYRRAIELDPQNVAALNNLGNLLSEQGRFDEGIAALRRTAQLCPDVSDVHANLGAALNNAGRFAEAIESHRRAISLNPNNSRAHSNLGTALAATDLLDQAIAVHRLAIELAPNSSGAYSNFGTALASANRFEESIAMHRKAIELAPENADAHNNLGKALSDGGDPEGAIAAYRRAISLRPDYALFHWNYAIEILSLGRFTEGWEEFEWRMRVGRLGLHRGFPQPMWDGFDLAGKTVLLHAQGGFGDAIHFVRYLPMVAERGGKIILECRPEQVRLFRQYADLAQIVARGDSLPPYDVQIPLQSLPRAFGANLTNLPATVPYLRAFPEDAKKWEAALSRESGRKVGLVWASRSGSNLRRSRTLEIFAPLAGVDAVQFHSLQKGPDAAQQPPPGLRLFDHSEELHDFADTAGLVANLDLVISIDTSVAHLAGAMGKPVWTLLPLAPDFRWLRDRQDSPWYPTMRLFRQKSPGRWDDVMNRVAGALKAGER